MKTIISIIIISLVVIALNVAKQGIDTVQTVKASQVNILVELDK